MTALLAALDAAGLIDAQTGLPLPSDRGRDNLPLGAAWLCELGTDEDREAIKPKVILYLEAARAYTQNGWMVPGVFHREAGNPDFNSQDNYTAIAYLSSKLGLGYAMEIYQHGYNCNWVFDNCDPSRGFSDELVKNGAREWFGRNIGFPPFVKSTAGFKLSFREQWQFGQAVESNFGREKSFAFNPDYTDVGNFSLQLLQNRAVKGRHWMTDAWIAWWARGMTRRYSDLAGMLQHYFKPVNGKEHPVVSAAKGRAF